MKNKLNFNSKLGLLQLIVFTCRVKKYFSKLKISKLYYHHTSVWLPDTSTSPPSTTSSSSSSSRRSDVSNSETTCSFRSRSSSNGEISGTSKTGQWSAKGDQKEAEREVGMAGKGGGGVTLVWW